MTIHRRAPENPGLSPATVAILLHGWSADAPEPSEHGFGGGFLELLDPSGPQTLWENHERFLRATAARWGWQPSTECSDGRLRFWAESLSDGFQG